MKVDLVETAPFHNEEKLSITLGGAPHCIKQCRCCLHWSYQSSSFRPRRHTCAASALTRACWEIMKAIIGPRAEMGTTQDICNGIAMFGGILFESIAIAFG